ncbi:leucine-rich repeat and immunoglobulin-like domain-containing nogo receptor-interacting protein 4a isoform X1 [Brachyhypopomus gauderio]|uniref:leucine-rich repeat and immunoglobulin-like domain-containing nogo receptor-interacting protein 4a isoform X1 n=1 Tax=Brachyhypopomus gauderio TaxID=698409 RepID=UPI004042D54A
MFLARSAGADFSQMLDTVKEGGAYSVLSETECCKCVFSCDVVLLGLVTDPGLFTCNKSHFRGVDAKVCATLIHSAPLTPLSPCSLASVPPRTQAELRMCVETAHWQGMCWCSVLLLIMGVSASGEPPWSCPQNCECLTEILMVNCSSCHLISVPEGISSKTHHLSLANNLIKKLRHRQFSTLVQLQELDLSENMLSTIEVEAFHGLQNLLTLRLSRNRLKILPVGVFSGVPNLHLLDISQNEILIFLDYTFREMTSLQKLEASENDVLFISKRAFSGLLNLKELILDRSNLTSVPSEALSQLTGLSRLRLCRAELMILPNNSFRRLGRLRELTVSNCPWLGSLDTNSLIGLNLTSLTLSYCNLSSVPYVPLQHLVYLSYLDLSYNPITSIQPNLLGDLLRLQEFHLVGGSLVRVEPGAFHGLAYFRMLNMSSNRLSTLEETTFHSVGTLKVLRLDSNPLTCDCRLLWILRHHLHLDFDKKSPTCNLPVHVQGRMIQDFTQAELPGLFTCRQARILNRKPQEVRTDEGRTVLFFCQVDGDPTPSIIWMNPNRILLSTTGRIRVLSNGTLEVRYSQVQDSGYYHCLASNAAGNDSISVSLQVQGFPASSTQNRSAHFFMEDWSFTATQSPVNNSQGALSFPFDMKTLIIAVTLGFLSFLSSVAVCFVFIFFWSQSKGQIKHTATIDFVPRSAGTGPARGGSGSEPSRLTMKLL